MSVSSLPGLTTTIAAERAQDSARVQALIERAFGPGRFAKAAERLREGNMPDLSLSFVAWAQNQVVGCVRMWPIVVDHAPAILLGPFAVDDAWRGQGLGKALVETACEAARTQGRGLILLVGDEPFFRKFGFQAAPPGQIKMPGPVDSRRVLWRWSAGDRSPPSGVVTLPPRGAA
ncbi:MAG TPA: N-acetyltransferase [Caulobacteraceae bacterium]|nr:N-acetyltransferase [Caulobacteraceae bacterium]